MARILLAEDDLQLSETLSEILYMEGHTVFTVQDGHSAWELLTINEPFDVLITDHFMPVVDGETLVRHVAENPKLNHLKVILMSGIESLSNNKRIDVLLIKPFNVQDIIEYLR